MISSKVIAAMLGLPAPTLEQQEIIESRLEPAVVVAGAGSGKTETMSARVVYLLANDLVRSDQVLGLTFTKKAANELAERIEHRINALAEVRRLGILPKSAEIYAKDGFKALDNRLLKNEFPDAGIRQRKRHEILKGIAKQWGCVSNQSGDSLNSEFGEPEIATYNSFADSIVRNYGFHVGLNEQAQLQSEASAWLLMRDIVLESDDPRLSDTNWSLNTVVERAIALAGQIDDNLVDLENLRAFPQYFDQIKSLPSTRKANPLLKFIEEDTDRISSLSCLVDLVEIYQQRKRELAVIDFSDQLSGAFKVISTKPEIAEQIRSQYRAVLLDEYQDTSVVQTKLLSKLFAQHPVMAVGDTNQAIYTWRGASANNLSEFPNDFAPGHSCGFFQLSTSWRNDQQILDAANSLISDAPDAANKGPAALKNLAITLEARPGAGAGFVDVIWAENIDEEAKRTAAWFKERISADTSAAILFRSRGQMRHFEEALVAAGLPFQTIGRGGLLSAPEIVDVISALKLLHDPGAGSELVRLLSGPRWQVSLADLKQLLRGAKRLHHAARVSSKENVELQIAEAAEDSSITLLDSLIIFAQVSAAGGYQKRFFSGLSVAAQSRLREAGEVFSELLSISSASLPEVIDLIVKHLRIDIELLANESRGSVATVLRNLSQFKTEVRQFAAIRDDGGIGDLVDWLDYLAEHDSLTLATSPAQAGVIQLMTIHASKGLEWDFVAVPRMVQGGLPNSPKTVRAWLSGGLPYSFRGDAKSLPNYQFDDPEISSQQELSKLRDAFIQDQREYQLAEERRLAYVAVTRARSQLLLSGCSKSSSGALHKVSEFLEEMCLALGIEVPVPELFDSDERSYSPKHWPRDPLGRRRERVEAAADRVYSSASGSEQHLLSEELQLLLRERDSGGLQVVSPTRIAASSFHNFQDDYQSALEQYLRPMPQRPYRQSRLGTMFHSWVENRSTGRSYREDLLWNDDTFDEKLRTENNEVHDADAAALIELQEKFLASPWAQLKPIAVEHEIQYVDRSLSDSAHIIVCKMDAVYKHGERVEIVDWKTGRAPASKAETAEKLVQLEVYRQAYHQHHGISLDKIDVTLFYVASGTIIRG